MEDLFREKVKFFLGGAIAGGIPSGIGLFSLPILGANLGELITQYAIRFFGTIVVAFMSGILTVMFKDFYDIVMRERVKGGFHWMNRKISRKKKVKTINNEQQKRIA